MSDDQRSPDDEPPHGTVHSTGPGPLCVFGGIGLIIGWAIRPLSIRNGWTEPTVSWLQVGIVFFLAAGIGWAAYATWRGRRDGVRLEAHRAVNRLVLGKTCALVGALVAGGYFGNVLAHVGLAGSEGANTQLWHSALAGVGGLVLLAAALLLEQACRIHDEER